MQHVARICSRRSGDGKLPAGSRGRALIWGLTLEDGHPIIVSDIAIFVLKRDVKLQLTNWTSDSD